MNYLAHIYLSGENTDVQIGNFMGDAVKGRNYENYAVNLKKGILLHRQIDSFTDQHAIISQSKKRLHPRYGHYKGVLIDIFYDYFLAKNWTNYSDVAFDKYVVDFYMELELKHAALPSRIQMMVPHLIQNNWFGKYNKIEGIARVLNGMEKRIIHDIPLHRGIEDLKDQYDLLEQDFKNFFPEIQSFSKEILEDLNKQFS